MSALSSLNPTLSIKIFFFDFFCFFRSDLDRERDRDLRLERSEDSFELSERLRFFFEIISESIFCYFFDIIKIKFILEKFNWEIK